MKHPDPETIGAALCLVARPLILQRYGPDSCIIGTRICIEAFEAFGHDAEALPVRVFVANTAWMEGKVGPDFDPLDRATWAEGAWTVGMGFRQGEDKTGHLMAHCGDTLVDLSLDQASRPAHGIVLPPALFKTPPGFREGTAGCEYKLNGCLIAYVRAPETDRWWSRSPNWGRRDAKPRREIVATVIRAVRSGLVTEVMDEAKEMAK